MRAYINGDVLFFECVEDLVDYMKKIKLFKQIVVLEMKLNLLLFFNINQLISFI